MSLFDKLLVAHLVSDWLLQTEWQALNKRKNLWALFSHILVYSIIMLGVLGIEFGFQSVYVYLVVGMLGLSHALLDRGWFVIRLMRAFRLVVERQPERWLVMAVDQVLHIVFLALAVMILP